MHILSTAAEADILLMFMSTEKNSENKASFVLKKIGLTELLTSLQRSVIYVSLDHFQNSSSWLLIPAFAFSTPETNK